jgi:hypothetical protein
MVLARKHSSFIGVALRQLDLTLNSCAIFDFFDGFHLEDEAEFWVIVWNEIDL